MTNSFCCSMRWAASAALVAILLRAGGAKLLEQRYRLWLGRLRDVDVADDVNRRIRVGRGRRRLRLCLGDRSPPPIGSRPSATVSSASSLVSPAREANVAALAASTLIRRQQTGFRYAARPFRPPHLARRPDGRARLPRLGRLRHRRRAQALWFEWQGTEPLATCQLELTALIPRFRIFFRMIRLSLIIQGLSAPPVSHAA